MMMKKTRRRRNERMCAAVYSKRNETKETRGVRLSVISEQQRANRFEKQTASALASISI